MSAIEAIDAERAEEGGQTNKHVLDPARDANRGLRCGLTHSQSSLLACYEVPTRPLFPTCSTAHATSSEDTSCAPPTVSNYLLDFAATMKKTLLVLISLCAVLAASVTSF